MKIAYIHTDPTTNHYECFSVKSSRYGGTAIAARFLKEKLNNSENTFHLYAAAECYNNLTDQDNRSVCFPLSLEARIALNKGEPIKNHIPIADDYDIICHGNCTEWLNTEGIKAKMATWCIGAYENVHKLNKNLLFFNYEGQKPVIQDKEAKIYKIIIAPELPSPPSIKEREDYIFFCSRQNEIMGSRILINLCERFEIPLKLAGKLDQGYEWIEQYYGKNGNDRRFVNFLGELDQNKKIELTQNSRCVSILHQWHSPFSLLGIEAQHYGIPLIVTNFGWWNSYIINGVNGFIIETREQFREVYERCKNINPLDCYNESKKYNANKMCETFLEAFKQILQCL